MMRPWATWSKTEVRTTLSRWLDLTTPWGPFQAKLCGGSVLQRSLGLLWLLHDFENFGQGVWYNSLIYQSSLHLRFIRNMIYFLSKKNVLVKAWNTKINCRDSDWKSWKIYCYIQLDSIFLQFGFRNISCVTLHLLKIYDWLLACGPDLAKYLECTTTVSWRSVLLAKWHLSFLACEKKEAKIHRLPWTVSSSAV